MPLPDASKKSPRVYTLLQNTDLDSVTFANVQAVGNPIAIEEANEDEMRRLVLVNLCRLVTSGEWSGLLSAGGGGVAWVLPTPKADYVYGDYSYVNANPPWGDCSTATRTASSVEDQTNWFPFIASTSGDVTGMQLVIEAAAASECNMLIGVYSDNDGFPGTLAGFATFDATSAATVVVTSFSDTITTVQGTQYWIGYTRSHAVSFQYTSRNGASSVHPALLETRWGLKINISSGGVLPSTPPGVASNVTGTSQYSPQVGFNWE